MTREEWEQGIQNWQKTGGQEGRKAAAKDDPPSDNPIMDIGRYGLEAAKGVGKAIVRDVQPQGGLLLSKEHAKEARDWADSPGDYPVTQSMAGGAAELAPYAAVPETGLYGLGARAFNAAGKLPEFYKYGQKAMQGIDWAANRAFQGGVGGAGANPDHPVQGALTGAGAGLTLGSLAKILHGGREMLGTGLGAAEVASHLAGHYLPWWGMYRLLHPLTHMARRAIPSGIAGNVTERGAQSAGYDTTQNSQ